jgi:hypothetical protein
MCEESLPTLCSYDAGQAPQCVDTTIDPANCGGCGVTCKLAAACNAGACGTEPSQLVAPNPGCLSMRVVYDSGKIYWSDMGHGTISSVSAPVTAGGDAGVATTIASGLRIAAVQTPQGPLQWPDTSGPALSTALLVRAGTVYWIGTSTPSSCTGDGGPCSGGVGTTIMSATAGSAPKTLLSMGMDPGPSPVSATDAAETLETPGQNPPINAIALSPDGSTLYFAAGTRFYSIPSTGGTVTYVGYAQGPEHGEATALAVDDTYLYYPSNISGNVEILKLGSMCDLDASPWTMAIGNDGQPICPVRIALSQGGLVYDTITAKGGFVYWGNDTSIRRVDVAATLAGISTGIIVGDDFPMAAQGTPLSAIAVGTQSAYFAEPGTDSVCSGDHSQACAPVLPAGSTCDKGSGTCGSLCNNAVYVCPEATPAGQTCVTLGYVEKGAAPPFDGSTPNAIILARDQPTATSLALDGTNVYWTTSRCDISYITDPAQ